jgi:hypothetical protein
MALREKGEDRYRLRVNELKKERGNRIKEQG